MCCVDFVFGERVNEWYVVRPFSDEYPREKFVIVHERVHRDTRDWLLSRRIPRTERLSTKKTKTMPVGAAVGAVDVIYACYCCC